MLTFQKDHNEKAILRQNILKAKLPRLKPYRHKGCQVANSDKPVSLLTHRDQVIVVASGRLSTHSDLLRAFLSSHPPIPTAPTKEGAGGEQVSAGVPLAS